MNTITSQRLSIGKSTVHRLSSTEWWVSFLIAIKVKPLWLAKKRKHRSLLLTVQCLQRCTLAHVSDKKWWKALLRSVYIDHLLVRIRYCTFPYREGIPLLPCAANLLLSVECSILAPRRNTRRNGLQLWYAIDLCHTCIGSTQIPSAAIRASVHRIAPPTYARYDRSISIQVRMIPTRNFSLLLKQKKKVYVSKWGFSCRKISKKNISRKNMTKPIQDKSSFCGMRSWYIVFFCIFRLGKTWVIFLRMWGVWEMLKAI